jgi:hypothetical protein
VKNWFLNCSFAFNLYRYIQVEALVNTVSEAVFLLANPVGLYKLNSAGPVV